jgi:hypothetical protein
VAAAIAFAVAVPAATLGAAPASVEDRARDFLVLRLKEALVLTDGETAEVRELIHHSEDRRRELRAARAKIEEEIRRKLGTGTPGKGDAAELDRLVGEANRLDEELALLPEKNNRDLQRMLTPEQRAKLILFRPRMQEEVRRAIRQRLEARGAGTPPN